MYLIIFAIALFFFVRILVVWPQREKGCDAYNILLNAEVFRERKCLPIKVPRLFVLEEQNQWYPPGFLILCALFPNKFLAKWHWLINHIIDFGTALLIFYVSITLGANIYIAVLGVVVYGIMPGLVTEFSSLNARAFGLLLFNLLMISSIYFVIENSFFSVALVCFFSLIIFYTHKLSVQQVWFLLPVLAVYFQEILWFIPLLMIYLLSYVCWPYGAKKIINGHVNIIKFWNKNWNNLGTHSIRGSNAYTDSPINNGFYSDESYFAYIRFFKDVIHQNYFVFPVLVGFLLNEHENNYVEQIFFIWIVSVYVCGIGIHCFKFLRGIGLGRQYFKFALLPSFIFCVLTLSESNNYILWSVSIFSVFLTLRQYVLIVKNALKNKNVVERTRKTDLDEVFSYIEKNNDDICILALPIQLCDILAYKTKKKVYWGTHSDIFDERLEDFFPIMRYPLEYYVKDGVTHVLIDVSYVDAKELELNQEQLDFSSGHYFLYDLKDLKNV